MFAIVALEVD